MTSTRTESNPTVPTRGDHLKDNVDRGIDSTATTFAIVAGAEYAGSSHGVAAATAAVSHHNDKWVNLMLTDEYGPNR